MDNFLEKIKKEQDNQVIQPSADAWERMDAMLVAQAQADKKKRRKFFLAYAAVFLGLLVGLTTFFSKDRGQGLQHDIVKTQIVMPVDSSSKPDAIKKVLQKPNKLDNNIASTSIEKVKQAITKKHSNSNSKSHQIVQHNQIAQVQPVKQVIAITKPINVAQVEQPKVTLHKEKKPLMQSSEAAINAMLANALRKDTVNNTNTYQLQVAESTLQQTAATKGDMTVNKFLKHVVQSGVDTVSDIITSNDN